MTYLTVPIAVSSVDKAKVAIRQAVSAGAEMLELRLDYLQPLTNAEVTDVVAAAVKAKLPVIATCRPNWEGGRFEGDEEERQLLLQQAVKAGAEYVDLEFARLDEKAVDFYGAKVIVSNHDFDRLPDDIHKRLENIKIRKRAVAKLAYMAERITDCFAALDMLRQEKDLIALAMGEAGVITRLFARKLGAFLMFASLEKDKESAPGQVTIDEMKNIYRWDAITADTKVYGIIGCPVGHSLSPVIHNAAFDETGFNGLYVPLLIAESREEFSAFLDGVRERKWLDIRGLSVTIPHKQNALEYVRANGGELEVLAERIGAVNTLSIDSNGKVSGYNTDYAGAMDALVEAMGIQRVDMKGVTVAILGAGGVARAIVAGLTDVGAEVSIYNRTVSKGRKLAEEFGCRWGAAAELAEMQSLDVKVVINCTSLGMHPKVEGTPIKKELIKKGMVVFDTVYNPLETRLLRDARQAGAQAIDGLQMLINQAALQFKIFTGKPAPKEVMRRAALDNIMKKQKTT